MLLFHTYLLKWKPIKDTDSILDTSLILPLELYKSKELHKYWLDEGMKRKSE
jgi:hypothetical protein